MIMPQSWIYSANQACGKQITISLHGGMDVCRHSKSMKTPEWISVPPANSFLVTEKTDGTNGALILIPLAYFLYGTGFNVDPSARHENVYPRVPRGSKSVDETSGSKHIQYEYHPITSIIFALLSTKTEIISHHMCADMYSIRLYGCTIVSVELRVEANDNI